MKILVEKELLESLLNTLRDVNVFMGQGFHQRAGDIFEDVCSLKSRIANILIVNSDANRLNPHSIINEMLQLEVEIFRKKWAMEDDKAAELRVKSDRLKNELLSLVGESDG